MLPAGLGETAIERTNCFANLTCEMFCGMIIGYELGYRGKCEESKTDALLDEYWRDPGLI